MGPHPLANKTATSSPAGDAWSLKRLPMHIRSLLLARCSFFTGCPTGFLGAYPPDVYWRRALLGDVGRVKLRKESPHTLCRSSPRSGPTWDRP